MISKLRNTILAFSASGVMLLVGLVAAQPLPTTTEFRYAEIAVDATGTMAVQEDASDPAIRETSKPRRARAVREAISIPYFSFSRGARGTRS